MPCCDRGHVRANFRYGSPVLCCRYALLVRLLMLRKGLVLCCRLGRLLKMFSFLRLLKSSFNFVFEFLGVVGWCAGVARCVFCFVNSRYIETRVNDFMRCVLMMLYA